MKRSILKKILFITAFVTLLLIAILSIHIYIVTRPQAPDAYTIAMSRIDIKQPITKSDADNITSWLYQQKGINHVLVNVQTGIVVFTFYPIKTSSQEVYNHFASNFSYKAERFVPTAEQLNSGCPVANNSVTYKMVSSLKKLF
jgi:hypothetical protein